MKDFVEDKKPVKMPEAVRKVMDRLPKDSKGYRQYLAEKTQERVEEKDSFSAPTKKPKAIFSRSRINDYVPPKVADGIYGFKVDAQTLTDLMKSDLPALQNLKVHSDGSGKAFFVKADNNAGNKYLSELTRPSNPVQMNAETLQRILGSENQVLTNANIDVTMVDKDHPSFAERPYSVFTSNKQAYNLIRAIAVDVTTPYEGEIIRDAEGKRAEKPSNVVELPKKKTKWGRVKQMTKAAAVFVAGVFAPWGTEIESQQGAVVSASSVVPTVAIAGNVPDAEIAPVQSVDVPMRAVAPMVAPKIPELNFTRPAISHSFTVEYAPPVPLTALFQAENVDVTPVVTLREPVSYVTQAGDSLWSIVEREFEAQGIDKGEGYANMLDRLDQYVEANPSLAYNPSALPRDFNLVVPAEDAPRAECNWSRKRVQVCIPSA